MEIRDRFKAGNVLRQHFQLVLGDIKAGQLAKLVNFHGKPGQLVVVQPEF
jgi:hypothetical protein